MDGGAGIWKDVSFRTGLTPVDDWGDKGRPDAGSSAARGAPICEPVLLILDLRFGVRGTSWGDSEGPRRSGT
jgi:hypothetical protein